MNATAQANICRLSSARCGNGLFCAKVTASSIYRGNLGIHGNMRGLIDQIVVFEQLAV